MIDKHVSLNMDVRGLEQSITIAINDKSKKLQKEGKSIYRLGLGQSPFPVPLPVVQALKSHAHEKDYLPAMGLPELREAVANFHRRREDISATGDQVLIGPGSKELMFLLQLTFYGELLVPTPCWVSYVPQAKILGRKVSLIHTNYENKWRITADLLQEHIDKENDKYRPRILILNYPGNPEGSSYEIKELKEIAEVACKYQIILLSDEIYGLIHHEGKHISISRFCQEMTIISSGLSKWCGAGGWRLGTFTFPTSLRWLQEAMAAVASETFTSVSAPIQYASITAFQGGTEIERYLCHSRRILHSLGMACWKILTENKIKVHPPVGGFYLFLDFVNHTESLKNRGISDSRSLCRKLLDDTGVAILPGESFGRDPKELTARMAYVDFDGAMALAASETIMLDNHLPDDFAQVNCSKVIHAMELIGEWLNN